MNKTTYRKYIFIIKKLNIQYIIINIKINIFHRYISFKIKMSALIHIICFFKNNIV
jgi:hypothetical protein